MSEQSAEMEFVLPLIGGHAVTFRLALPLNEAQWAGMMTILETMKPGLVADCEHDWLCFGNSKDDEWHLECFLCGEHRPNVSLVPAGSGGSSD